ncbi:DUF397 domain-containing protein [Streptomyces sp. NBC_01808]|uniref:DUF397 domain-containing protein n=1 Tax=Streptomyces sp. NBC_01808 TaxID=2975947 RepID=UPI002DD9C1DD|nr:DUF397 domain-containing protein [Streptomyces sp. NBC_01808]WSA38587.1 DUF397 domain-containing protein [Streptomyces sp. NBC_01808]
MSSRSEWFKSAYSGQAGNCVEVAAVGPDRRLIRDSKDPGGGVLAVSGVAWADFVEAVKRGEFPQT